MKIIICEFLQTTVWFWGKWDEKLMHYLQQMTRRWSLPRGLFLKKVSCAAICLLFNYYILYPVACQFDNWGFMVRTSYHVLLHIYVGTDCAQIIFRSALDWSSLACKTTLYNTMRVNCSLESRFYPLPPNPTNLYVTYHLIDGFHGA